MVIIFREMRFECGVRLYVGLILVGGILGHPFYIEIYTGGTSEIGQIMGVPILSYSAAPTRVTEETASIEGISGVERLAMNDRLLKKAIKINQILLGIGR